MKATMLLRRDHETLQSLFARLQQSASNERIALFEELLQEIRAHSGIEEELFYPEIENTASTAAVELVATARRQHQAIDSLLDKIESQGPAPTFDGQMAQLMKNVEEHLAFEERELFEEARQSLSEFRMEQLGLEMEERRRFLTRSAA